MAKQRRTRRNQRSRRNTRRQRGAGFLDFLKNPFGKRTHAASPMNVTKKNSINTWLKNKPANKNVGNGSANQAANLFANLEQQGLAPNNMVAYANQLSQPMKNAFRKQLKAVGYLNNNAASNNRSNAMTYMTNTSMTPLNNGGFTSENNPSGMPRLVSSNNNTIPAENNYKVPTNYNNTVPAENNIWNSRNNNTIPAENNLPMPAPAPKKSWFSRLFTRGRKNNAPTNSANAFVTNQMSNLKSPQQIVKMVNSGTYNNTFKQRVRNVLRKKGYSV